MQRTQVKLLQSVHENADLVLQLLCAVMGLTSVFLGRLQRRGALSLRHLCLLQLPTCNAVTTRYLTFSVPLENARRCSSGERVPRPESWTPAVKRRLALARHLTQHNSKVHSQRPLQKLPEAESSLGWSSKPCRLSPRDSSSCCWAAAAWRAFSASASSRWTASRSDDNAAAASSSCKWLQHWNSKYLSSVSCQQLRTVCMAPAQQADLPSLLLLNLAW